MDGSTHPKRSERPTLLDCDGKSAKPPLRLPAHILLLDDGYP